MLRKISILLVFCAILSCEKKDEEPIISTFNAALTLKKCTGLNLVDENGQALGSVGNPNVKSPVVFPYPNPAESSIFISTQEELLDFYIVKAEKDTTFEAVDYSTLLAANPFDFDSIVQQKYFNGSCPNCPTFIVNTDTFEAGYYRFFFRMTNDSIYCDNVYIDPNTFILDSRTKIFDDWK